MQTVILNIQDQARHRLTRRKKKHMMCDTALVTVSDNEEKPIVMALTQQTLFEWQANLARRVSMFEKVLCFSQTGTGKTRAAVAAIRAKELTGNVLIVMYNWANELNWTNELKKCCLNTRVFNSSKKTVPDDMVLLTTYSTLRAKNTNQRLFSKRFDLIIFDEAHVLKNDSQQSKAAHRLIGDHVLPLTATPFHSGSGMEDLAPILKITGFSETVISDLKKRVQQETGVDRGRALNEFVKAHAVVATLKEVGEHIPRCDVVLYLFQLNDENSKAQLILDKSAQRLRGMAANSFGVRRFRLMIAAGCATTRADQSVLNACLYQKIVKCKDLLREEEEKKNHYDRSYSEDNEEMLIERISALESEFKNGRTHTDSEFVLAFANLFQRFVHDGYNHVVFPYNSHAYGSAVYHYMMNNNVHVIYGGERSKDRHHAFEQAKTIRPDDIRNVLYLMPASCSHGVNLQNFNGMILVPTNRPIHDNQKIARIYRVGQNSTTRVAFIVARNTDQNMMFNLRYDRCEHYSNILGVTCDTNLFLPANYKPSLQRRRESIKSSTHNDYKQERREQLAERRKQDRNRIVNDSRHVDNAFSFQNIWSQFKNLFSS